MKILKIFKKIKIRTLLFLIALLAFNTYAWFVYVNNVAGSIKAHITSWDVEFKTGEEAITTNIRFDVDRVYPGMDTYTKIVKVHNKGEMSAIISYEVKSITILGVSYEQDDNTTSSDLENMIMNDFPFHLNINIDSLQLSPGDGECQFEVSFDWPFESGNDEIDTYWGEKAYEYYSVNPNTTSIQIEIAISAIQQ